MRNGLSVFFLWIISLSALSQKKNASYIIHIHHTSGPILIDGVLDEPSWKEAEVARNFFMILPMDTSLANVRTEVRIMYSDKYIYLSAVCFDGIDRKSVV